MSALRRRQLRDALVPLDNFLLETLPQAPDSIAYEDASRLARGCFAPLLDSPLGAPARAGAAVLQLAAVSTGDNQNRRSDFYFGDYVGRRFFRDQW